MQINVKMVHLASH